LQHCHQCLSILHNYFDDLTKLFSNQYLTKFLDTSAKPFFPCTDYTLCTCLHLLEDPKTNSKHYVKKHGFKVLVVDSSRFNHSREYGSAS